MALNDFVFRLKAASGQATPRDEVTGSAVLGTNSGCTVSLVDTGSGVMAWRFLNGSVSSAMPAAIAALNLNDGSGDAGITVVFRGRVEADQFGVTNLRLFQLGGSTSAYDGVSITRPSAADMDVQYQAAGATHTGAASTTLRNYVIVVRPNSGVSGEDAIDTWITTAGRVGSAPNGSAALSLRTGGNLDSLSTAPTANGYATLWHEVLVYRNAKTNADAALLADTADLGSIVASDSTPPTLTGSITQGATTTTSIAVTCPTGSDNVAVTGYDFSSNGGSTWLASGTPSYTFTGLSAGTTYAIRARARDAAGNLSTPVLTASFSTSADPVDSTPPTLTGSITQGSTTASSIVITWPTGADNVAVTSYEVSSNGGGGYVASNGATSTTTSHTFTGLASSTAYAIRVRAKDGAGNVSTPALAASFSTLSTTTPPSISVEPQPVSAQAGSGATFSVSASGTAPLSYQWYRNNVAILGATVSSYSLTGLTLPDTNAVFKVVITNPYGTATSVGAVLTVYPAPVGVSVFIGVSLLDGTLVLF